MSWAEEEERDVGSDSRDSSGRVVRCVRYSDMSGSEKVDNGTEELDVRSSGSVGISRSSSRVELEAIVASAMADSRVST